LRPRAATTAVFFINGAMVGTWIAHIPYMQDRLGVSKATIGVALLCMALGALVAMPITGQILHRRPSAQVVRAAALVYCLLGPLPIIAPTPVALGALLVVFGAFNGAMDVSMNAHGVAVERELGKPIMSSLHAGWSFGGFFAAAIASLATAGGVDARAETVAMTVVMWVTALLVTARLGHASTHDEAATGFALPSRGVLLLGALCFLALVVEGSMNDWSGIYLRHNLGAGAAAASLGFAGFSLGMALCRVGGDKVNERVGPEALLRGGMLLVAAALGALLLIAQPVAAVIGFTLAGLGVANGVPIMFSAAGRIPPSGPSLAAVFTVGYTGFLAGPPILGAVADAIGLPATLGLVGAAAVVVAALARRGLSAGDSAARTAAAPQPVAHVD
jgi:predicted MFS family arabinose efflux permease